ncbi:MAG: tRNA (N6-isopentenyl adenosine(37)-C2)-methylthiotransferase MiaB [Bdellovibrionaceae bacterium]|nr:tRNA (N6-isopentenyl adenosine(37)-C2)-methylthiotransferase MiaB [Pseudobdellovibrionaceae bacterium]MDW8189413.1 tRNA (N6-isopentenyl adenosine(37)-C2)-methylthiotransferase MiaB [Pseudobdellovibrionaceae bacterium]
MSQELQDFQTNSSQNTGESVPPFQRSVYISTYGCQMNENDTERMYALMEMAGYAAVASPEQADVIIINSCSVREKPVHKVFSEVGTYRRLKERRPHLKIGVGGCVASLEKERLIEANSLIDFVFGTDQIDLVPSLVDRAFAKKGIVEARFHHREPYQIETLIRNPKVTAFVNITKGCDNFCTFCVVPYTRGREKSRLLREVVEDIQKLVNRGVREVTLLGQNVNSYRSPCGADFADLLQALAEQTDLVRIRYTTSHPKDFNEKLMQIMERYQQKICEYIHLPVQSGSDRILERMNRGYSRKDYIAKIKKIKEYLPQVVLSTDIIVGFPGEDESDFWQTVDLVLEVGFETIFAFKYSPRPFTKAARFDQQIPETIKDERLQRLFQEWEKWAFPFVKQRYQGQYVEVLVEEFDQKRGQWHGRSRQNKNVYFQADKTLTGQLVHVLVEEAFPSVLRGRWMERESKQHGVG